MKRSLLNLAPVFVSVILVFAAVPRSLADDTNAAPATPAEPAATIPYTNDFATDPFHPKDSSLKWWTNNADQATWESDVIHQGKGAIKLTNTDVTKNTVIYGPYIPYSGPALSISAEIKGENIVGNGSSNKPAVSIYYYDSQRNPINTPSPSYHDGQYLPEGTSDWTTYTKQYPFPANATDVAFVRVVVNLIGTGAIYLDKVELHQTN